jgi:hypothetical protein
VANSCGAGVVSHLRFRLRSVFKLPWARVWLKETLLKLCSLLGIAAKAATEWLDVSEMSTMLKLLDLREQLVVRLATWEGM